MKPIIIGSAALGELKDAADFYADQNPELDQTFRLEVAAALTRIRTNPELYPAHARSEYQKCLTSRFPYAIYYLDFPDHVWVAAIAHSSRRPGYWLGRQPGDDL